MAGRNPLGETIIRQVLAISSRPSVERSDSTRRVASCPCVPMDEQAPPSPPASMTNRLTHQFRSRSSTDGDSSFQVRLRGEKRLVPKAAPRHWPWRHSIQSEHARKRKCAVCRSERQPDPNMLWFRALPLQKRQHRGVRPALPDPVRVGRIESAVAATHDGRGGSRSSGTKQSTATWCLDSQLKKPWVTSILGCRVSYASALRNRGRDERVHERAAASNWRRVRRDE